MPKYREYICECCGKTFQSCKEDRNRKPRFCSIKCASVRIRKMKVCAHCGREFYDWTKDKYCSRECAAAALRGVPLSDEHRRKLSEGRKASPKCHGAALYNWKGGAETYHERMRAHNKKRRDATRTPIDPAYLRLLRDGQRNRCFYCGTDMGNRPTLEHLTPVSKGGTNVEYNLVYACQSCNSKKHDSTLEEYIVRTGHIFLSERYDYILARIYTPYKILRYAERKTNPQSRQAAAQ